MAAKSTKSRKHVQTSSAVLEQQNQVIKPLLDLAIEHHSAGRLPQAESIYQQILLGNPDQPFAMQQLGVIANLVGKWDLALELITRAISLEPDSAMAYNDRGSVLQSMGRLKEAIEN